MKRKQAINTHKHPFSLSTDDYRGKLRYRFIFSVCRPIIRVLAWILFNYKATVFAENKEDTYFILSNHTGSLDPLLLSLSFKRPIFFVASDHLFRMGWVSKLVDYLVAPIPIVKSKLDLEAIRTIYYELGQGRTLALFPSGNRSVAGPEEAIPSATGKLIKKLKIPVLLFRIEGGYLTSPRWAKHHRRGKMAGSVVLHLKKEDIEKATVTELDALLKAYLDADPYSISKQEKITYRGRRPAEHLERILYLCPSCLELAALESHKDLLTCPCGFKIRYSNSGYFSPATNKAEDRLWAERFPNIKYFYSWQDKKIKAIFSSKTMNNYLQNTALLTDENEVLTITQRAKKNIKQLKGKIILYKDRLEYKDESSGAILPFPLNSISDLSCIGPQRLQFTDSRDGVVYESQNNKARSAYKYIHIIQELKKKKKQE